MERRRCVKKIKRRYDKFIYRKEWMLLESSLPEKQRRIFSFAIMLYGCYGELSDALSGELLSYFQKEVIPDLDGQHELLEKGKDLWQSKVD